MVRLCERRKEVTMAVAFAWRRKHGVMEEATVSSRGRRLGLGLFNPSLSWVSESHIRLQIVN